VNITTDFDASGVGGGLSSAWTVSPVLVVVAEMVSTITSWLVSGLPFDLVRVPLAGTRRQVAHGDRQAGVGGEGGQLGLRLPGAVAVGAAAAGADQQASSIGMQQFSSVVPPGSDGVDRERGGVVVGAHRHPSGVGAHVVHPIRVGLAQFPVDEVVDLDLFRLAFSDATPGRRSCRPLPTPSFCIDTDHHLAGSIGLQAVAPLTQRVTMALTSWPLASNALVRARIDFDVHRNGDIGSPGHRVYQRLERRHQLPRRGPRRVYGRHRVDAISRPRAQSPASTSLRPRRTVSAATPVAPATTATPPGPNSAASAPNRNRR
jgi:hypothetical protein